MTKVFVLIPAMTDSMASNADELQELLDDGYVVINTAVQIVASGRYSGTVRGTIVYILHKQ